MNQIPNSILVTMGLLGGLFLIYILMPPFSACDAQFEVFQKSQTPFLFLDSTKSHIKKTGLELAISACMQANNSGGCFNLFEKSAKIIKDLKVVSSDCTDKVFSKSEIKQPMTKILKFMVLLAWGTTPPKSELDKDGWFDSLNKTIFCEVKSFYQENYKSEWNDFVDSALTELPGAQELGNENQWRELAWKRSVLSTPCSAYQ